MVTAKTTFWMIVIAGACLVPATWATTPPPTEPSRPLFINAGGPYYGIVGEPIEFAPYVASWVDANTVVLYCWDWYMDGRSDCGGPTRTHTWHCAYSGKVAVHIWDVNDNFAYDEAKVTVVGPETMACVELNSHADLHLYGPRLRHLGPDYDAGNIETEIPGGTFDILDADGNAVTYCGSIPAEGVTQQAMFPPYQSGPYTIELLGTADGPFELTVYGMQDGVCVAEQTYEGEIFDGETISLNMSVCCQDGCMDMDCGRLQYCPEMEVEPGAIDLLVEPDTLVTVPVTIREVGGRRPMCGAAVKCSDLKALVYTIKGSDITCDPSSFDVPPGGEQVVNVTIPIPKSFVGVAKGSLKVTCPYNVVGTVDVTVSHGQSENPD